MKSPIFVSFLVPVRLAVPTVSFGICVSSLPRRSASFMKLAAVQLKPSSPLFPTQPESREDKHSREPVQQPRRRLADQQASHRPRERRRLDHQSPSARANLPLSPLRKSCRRSRGESNSRALRDYSLPLTRRSGDCAQILTEAIGFAIGEKSLKCNVRPPPNGNGAGKQPAPLERQRHDTAAAVRGVHGDL